MSSLEKPTEQPQIHQHKLDETTHGILKELRALQINHSNQVRQLMAAILSTTAATQWGYTEDQVLTFDIDLDQNDPTVNVGVATPPPVAPQPATQLPAEHAPVEDAPKAELPPVEEVSSAPATPEVAQVAEAPAEPVVASEPEVPTEGTDQPTPA